MYAHATAKKKAPMSKKKAAKESHLLKVNRPEKGDDSWEKPWNQELGMTPFPRETQIRGESRCINIRGVLQLERGRKKEREKGAQSENGSREDSYAEKPRLTTKGESPRLRGSGEAGGRTEVEEGGESWKEGMGEGGGGEREWQEGKEAKKKERDKGEEGGCGSGGIEGETEMRGRGARAVVKTENRKGRTGGGG